MAKKDTVPKPKLDYVKVRLTRDLEMDMGELYREVVKAMVKKKVGHGVLFDFQQEYFKFKEEERTVKEELEFFRKWVVFVRARTV